MNLSEYSGNGSLWKNMSDLNAVKIEVVRNGYILNRADSNVVVYSPCVFETMDALVDFLRARLKKPTESE